MNPANWMKLWSLSLLIFLYAFAQVASHDLLRNQISQKQFHLPLILNSQRTSLAERRELGSAGLGDYLDMLVSVS